MMNKCLFERIKQNSDAFSRVTISSFYLTLQRHCSSIVFKCFLSRRKVVYNMVQRRQRRSDVASQSNPDFPKFTLHRSLNYYGKMQH